MLKGLRRVYEIMVRGISVYAIRACGIRVLGLNGPGKGRFRVWHTQWQC